MQLQTQLIPPVTFLFGAMNYMYSPTSDEGEGGSGIGEIRRLPGRETFAYADTNLGRVKGTKETSRVGKSFYQFRGIPYAEPPVGELRFEPPVPNGGWEGVLDATRFGAQCWQMSVVTRRPMGEEDCLFLNVYTRKAYTRDELPDSEGSSSSGEGGGPHPVIVFIHGGLFMSGGSNLYRPKYFLDEDVVLVTVNYRLASFGFLNTGDGLVKGNMGLKDQTLALRWVQENIHFFNGDPIWVTLMGESAGSVSVHLHTLSPMSRGLFSGAISQSGTALAPWAVIPEVEAQSKEFAKGLDCPTDDPVRMVKCLKEVPGGKIARYHMGYINAVAEGAHSLFGPTVEKRHGRVQNKRSSNSTSGNRIPTRFLPLDPLKLMKHGKISKTPWLSGVNSGEGLVHLIAIMRNDTMRKLLNSEWDHFAPLLLNYADHPDKDALSAKIKRYYLKDQPVTQRNAREAAEMLSDRQFFLDGHDAAILQAKVAPTYVYYYTYQGLFALGNLLFSKTPLPLPNNLDYMVGTVENWLAANVLRHRRRSRLGICHSDEIPLLFNVPLIRREIDRNDQDYKFSRKLVKLWVSFAENGVPDTSKAEGKETVPWESVSETNPELEDVALTRMNIDKRLGTMEEPFWGRIRFWKNNSIGYI